MTLIEAMVDGFAQEQNRLEEAQQKPMFNADAAEEYFSSLCAYYRDEKNRIFKRDNEGRHPSELIYSAESQKLPGKELAMREVLEYFSKFDFSTWRPGSEAPKTGGQYLVAYHFPMAPIIIHFYGVFDYYLTDPEPHWQHTLTENGPIIDRWMPIPPNTLDEEMEDTHGQTATD